MKFDTFLATVGDWGKFQKVKYTLICLTYMLPPIMVYTYTFTAATPNFRCENPDIMNIDEYSGSNNKLFASKFQPTEDQCKTQQKSVSISECQRCYIRPANGTQSSLNGKLEKCNKFIYDREHYTETLVEEVRVEKKKIFYSYFNFLLVDNDL